MSQFALDVNGLYKGYQQPVLQDVNFRLEAGQMLALLGHNGAGKTTLIKLILGLLRPDQGALTVLGQDPSDPIARRQMAIGYLPEQLSLYAQMTGKELLCYFARLRNVPIRRVDELLAELHLTEFAQRAVSQYSKGMRQRLGLAQALLGEPKLLLLDEPTVGLDPNSSAYLYHCLAEQAAKGCAVVVCTHELPLIEPHFDQALIMAKGQVIASGCLNALRQQSAVKTRITLGQGSEAVQQDPELSAHWNTALRCLSVSEEQKTHVITRLTQGLNLFDFSVTPASLTQIYHHYQPQTLGGPL